MTRKIVFAISIIISALLTINFSTFTNPILLMTLPGLLFGLALTIPNIHPDYKMKMTEFGIGLVYPIVWTLSFALSFFFQFITPSLTDKIPYFVIGLVSGLGTVIAFDWQFGLKKRFKGILTVTILGIFAVFLSDFLLPNPNDKELNIGKQIAIWEILVGFGLLINKKTPANNS